MNMTLTGFEQLKTKREMQFAQDFAQGKCAVQRRTKVGVECSRKDVRECLFTYISSKNVKFLDFSQLLFFKIKCFYFQFSVLQFKCQI